MAFAAHWTPDQLEDRIWALEVMLGRVQPDDLAGTPAAGLWTQAADWLRTAQDTVGRSDAATRVALLRPFPLSGAQLLELQATIERIAQAHRGPAQQGVAGEVERTYQSVMAAPLLSARGRVQATWRLAYRSSLEIAAVLVVVLALDVLELVVFRRMPQDLAIIGINVAATLVALGVWRLHHSDLHRHRWAVAWLHPRVARHD
jgi:hypothetical protein